MRRIAFAGMILLGLAWNCQAAPLAPTTASDVVSLQGFGNNPTGCNPFDVRITSDGLTQAFEIPAGYVLVVTGIQWFVAGTASKVLRFQLNVDGGAAFFSGGSLADADGQSAGSALIPQHAVRAGRTICAKLFPGTDDFIGNLHGFLARDGDASLGAVPMKN